MIYSFSQQLYCTVPIFILLYHFNRDKLRCFTGLLLIKASVCFDVLCRVTYFVCLKSEAATEKKQTGVGGGVFRPYTSEVLENLTCFLQTHRSPLLFMTWFGAKARKSVSASSLGTSTIQRSLWLCLAVWLMSWWTEVLHIRAALKWANIRKVGSRLSLSLSLLAIIVQSYLVSSLQGNSRQLRGVLLYFTLNDLKGVLSSYLQAYFSHWHSF